MGKTFRSRTSVCGVWFLSEVLIKRENNLGLIIFNNPSTHNALKKAEINLIKLALSEWRKVALDAILISGTGKSFCSGLFLEDLKDRDWQKNPITMICDEIENSPCPVICALNGPAYGGAVEIAISCDFRVANDKLSLMVPAAKLGIHYEPSGLRRAIDILGLSFTRRLFLLGELMPRKEIIKTHFVDFWVEDGETVIDRGKKIVEALSDKSPLAVSGMKKTILEILNNSLDAEESNRRILDCFNSSHHRESLESKKGHKK